MPIPVYLFTGFLESGKTRFIQQTMEDKRFNNGERTLMIVCEEGEEEYNVDRFSGKNIHFQYIDSLEDITEAKLNEWPSKHRVDRIIIEYNGMWPLLNLYQAMPEKWAIYQQIMTVDTSTIMVYNQNMRNLVFDKINGAELVIFNRFPEGEDKMPYHQLVRAITRRTDIAYEYENGEAEYDEIEDPLPFDLEAEIIEIADEDYALWYRDVLEDPKKYVGKKVHFKGMAAHTGKMPKGSFVPGRFVMTCCADDTQFMGFLCFSPESDRFPDKTWVMVTAEVGYEKVPGTRVREAMPVLKASKLALTSAPEEEVATFY